MDLLIVESRANWSDWNRLTTTLRQPLHVLVQHASESVDELYARVEHHLARPGSPTPRRIVALRANGPREIACMLEADLSS